MAAADNATIDMDVPINVASEPFHQASWIPAKSGMAGNNQDFAIVLSAFHQ